MNEKKCSKCKKIKSLDDFYKSKRYKSGRYPSCKECVGFYNEENKLKIAEQKRAYYYRNREKLLVQNRLYNKEHKIERNEYSRKWKQRKRSFDIFYKMNSNISRMIRKSVKDKDGSGVFDILGYTKEKLKKHLETTLPEGYIWKDFLEPNVLHIDHIIPINAYKFDSAKSDEFKKCWAMKNLRLLPIDENKKKSDTLNMELVEEYDLFHILPA